MALVVDASGTQAAVISTEHILRTTTTSGTFVLVVNTTAMANGDVTELRLYTKPLSGSTSVVAYVAIYSNVQASVVKYSVPVPCNNECKVTLKQTAGTGRSYEWALLQIDG